MSKTIRLSLALLFALLFVVGIHAPVSASTITIAQARSMPLGSVVTVEGYVTVASGDFSSATFDQGFAIQDDTAGIYVSVPDNLHLQQNRHVQVTGTLADSFALLILTNATVETLPGAKRVEPMLVNTGDVSESTEGLLLTVEGVITQPVGDDLPFGYRVYVDDGSGELQLFVHASTGIDPFTQGYFEVGRRVRATGFSGEFIDHFELDPRSPGDIHPVN
ncbi:MAG: DNA-binding protein [Chloroflexi bacterium]|nr:DNA-binding protein [Chloroflexota bacterium]